MMRQYRPNDAAVYAQGFLCRAKNSIQDFGVHLGCPRRLTSQCTPELITVDRPNPSASLGAFTELPEVLRAHVLEFSGNTGASSLSLASQDLCTSIWKNQEVWQARLAIIGVSATAGPTTDLQEEYRWRSCGIHALCKSGMQSAGTGSDGVTALKHARRAIKALTREDAAFMDLISMNLADLIRWYDYTDESAHDAARTLVQDIIGRNHLFTSEHVRDVSSAFDSACSLRELLLVAETELASEDEDPWDDFSTYDCEELLSRSPGSVDTFDDIPEFADGCDDEACERMMELLRSLPQDEGL